MTDVDTGSRATRTAATGTLARGTVAALLALAAPAVSFLPALTTDIHGSGAAVTFPHGYPVMLIITIAVTAAACVLGALIAGRTGLVAIPLGLALWAIIGFVITLAGASLSHHAHLTEWGNRAHGSDCGGGGRRAPAGRTAMTTGTRPATLIRTSSGPQRVPPPGSAEPSAADPAITSMPCPAGRVAVVAAAVPGQPDTARTPARRPDG
jgi:energy-coupling factor transporter transmembrane protein EcfT